jgi:hypothetical protein
MNKQATLNITAMDLRKGLRKSLFRCPIARSANRKFKGASSLVVTRHSLAVRYPTDLCYTSYRLPKVAREFINTFDDQGSVTPFSFKLGSRRE